MLTANDMNLQKLRKHMDATHAIAAAAANLVSTENMINPEQLAGDQETLTELLSNLELLTWTATDATKHAVRLARRAGLSWGVIGHALQISRQAAQQRYGN